MNNAGISRKTTAWTEIENWRKLLEVNLWGVINSVQTFVPGMIAQAIPGARDQYRLEAGHHHPAGQSRPTTSPRPA